MRRRWILSAALLVMAGWCAYGQGQAAPADQGAAQGQAAAPDQANAAAGQAGVQKQTPSAGRDVGSGGGRYRQRRGQGRR